MTKLGHICQFSLFFKFFKSTNILLSDDYEAKISNFGLAKLMPEGQETNVTQGGLLLFISAGSVPRVYLNQVVVVVAVFPPRLLSAKV
ncbi:hypothetical protein LXL04_019444 [Taraxacum kok-saghyz]